MTVNDVYKASALFSGVSAEGLMVMTFHYRTTNGSGGAGQSGEAQHIANGVRDGIQDDYLPELTDVVTLDRVEVVGVTNPVIQATATSGVSGTLTDDNLPWRSASVAALKTGLRGRSFNGRSFGIAPGVTRQDNGDLSAGFSTALQTFYDNLLLIIHSGGNEYSMTIRSDALDLDNLVQTVIIRPRFGSQRGRQSTQ